MPPELVVSDFAGPAFHDDGAILDAYRHALGKYEVPFDDAELSARRAANKHGVSYSWDIHRPFDASRRRSVVTL